MILCVAAAIARAAEVDAAFEGGSVGRVEKLAETHFRIRVKGETDQNGRNRQASWYYFRVRGAGGRTMTFDLVDLPGEYNFRPNRGAITGVTPPFVSYDGRTWTPVEDVEYDAAEPRLRLRIAGQGAAFRVAHTPPYTGEDLRRLRARVQKSSAVREEVVGKTPEARDVLLWTIGSGKRTAWLMFRQHSWESGSSWAGEGAVRALLEDARMQRAATWKIFPMCDPDGVARGGVRFNARGYDLNRNWDTIDARLMPEIAAQHGAVAKWVRGGGRVDLFVSLHNTETSEYLEGPPGAEGEVKALAERLFGALSRKQGFAPSRPLFFAEATTTQGMAGRMNVVQGLWRDFRVPAFLIEQRIAKHPKLGRQPGVEDRLEFGRGLAEAVMEALAGSP